MVERVVNRRLRIGDRRHRALRINDARADGEILHHEVLAVEHDARRRVVVDRDDVLASVRAELGSDGAHLVRLPDLPWRTREALWPARRRMTRLLVEIEDWPVVAARE